jgi:hypothetical protein
MSTEFFLEVRDLVSNNFNEACFVENIEDSETRFSYCVRFVDFSVTIMGTDARVCMRVKFSGLEKNIQKILLFAVCTCESDTRKKLSPYILSIWKNTNNNYLNMPSAEKLVNSKESYFEICTTPTDITTKKKAETAIKALLLKFLEWMASYRYDEKEGAIEGERQLYSQTRIERSESNRKRCIQIFGLQCQVCMEKMTDRYGELAKDFIHVHHIESIAQHGPRWIDPSKDLITVCPNCHSMLHRTDPPILPNKLRKIIGLKTES